MKVMIQRLTMMAQYYRAEFIECLQTKLGNAGFLHIFKDVDDAFGYPSQRSLGGGMIANNFF